MNDLITVRSEDHIMLDLETWGAGPNAAIASIGAVRFNPWSSGVKDCYAATISTESAMKYGRVDAGTLSWWMHSDRDAARQTLLDAPKFELDEALFGFVGWLESGTLEGNYKLWGNGATFDNVILKSAFAATGVDWPFTYRDDRCFRTLKATAPHNVKPDFLGTMHSAVDDAVHQALWLQKIVAHNKMELL